MEIFVTLNHTINTVAISSIETHKAKETYESKDIHHLKIHWNSGNKTKSEIIYEGSEKECNYLRKQLNQELTSGNESFISISGITEMMTIFNLKGNEYNVSPINWAIDLSIRYKP